jgi:hypothetical protein
VGFEPTTPVFERAKTVHALADCAAAVMGCYDIRYIILKLKQRPYMINLSAMLSDCSVTTIATYFREVLGANLECILIPDKA